jgi:excisionase family DNA binding protein
MHRNTIVKPDKSVTPALMTSRELAQYLHCSENHVFRMLQEGKLIAPVRIGRTTRWHRASVDEWLAAGAPPVENAE